MPPTMQNFIQVPVGKQIKLAVFRFAREDRVLMELALDENIGAKLDQHRLGILWVDDEVRDVASDVAGWKTMDAIMNDGEVTHSVGDTSVSWQIWHGKVNEGSGMMGKLLRAERLRLRVYLADFSHIETAMDRDALLELKQQVSRQIFGV